MTTCYLLKYRTPHFFRYNNNFPKLNKKLSLQNCKNIYNKSTSPWHRLSLNNNPHYMTYFSFKIELITYELQPFCTHPTIFLYPQPELNSLPYSNLSLFNYFLPPLYHYDPLHLFYSIGSFEKFIYSIWWELT